MVNREFPRALAGHFVSFPNTGSKGRQSETIWRTGGNSKATALSIPLSASGSIPPRPNGIAIFTCVRLACKRKQVKRKFCGRKFAVLRWFRCNNSSRFLTWRNGLFFNPKGIGSFSPALARLREGLRWVAKRKATTLKGLHINDLGRDTTLSRYGSPSCWTLGSSLPRLRCASARQVATQGW